MCVCVCVCVSVCEKDAERQRVERQREIKSEETLIKAKKLFYAYEACETCVIVEFEKHKHTHS